MKWINEWVAIYCVCKSWISYITAQRWQLLQCRDSSLGSVCLTTTIFAPPMCSTSPLTCLWLRNRSLSTSACVSCPLTADSWLSVKGGARAWSASRKASCILHVNALVYSSNMWKLCLVCLLTSHWLPLYSLLSHAAHYETVLTYYTISHNLTSLINSISNISIISSAKRPNIVVVAPS